MHGTATVSYSVECDKCKKVAAYDQAKYCTGPNNVSVELRTDFHYGPRDWFFFEAFQLCEVCGVGLHEKKRAFEMEIHQQVFGYNPDKLKI